MELRRRAVLAGAAAALAGCATVEDRIEDIVPPDGHPLEGTVSVAVVDRSDSDHDLETLADEAMRFWEDNAPEYVGFEVEYRRETDSRPDVEIVFLDDRAELQGCEEYASADILGCAPLLREGQRFERPATVEVVATDRPYGEVRITTKHELGHTLGLGHDDEPAYIMSNRIEDRLPEYESRVQILETTESVWKTRNEGTTAYNDGIERWNDEEYERAVEPLERAADRYRTIPELVGEAETTAEAFEGMERPDTVDLSALREQFEQMRAVGSLSAEMASTMAEAARAAADGDRSRARDLREDAAELRDQLREMTFPSPADIGRALGLVREETT